MPPMCVILANWGSRAVHLCLGPYLSRTAPLAPVLPAGVTLLTQALHRETALLAIEALQVVGGGIYEGPSSRVLTGSACEGGGVATGLLEGVWDRDTPAVLAGSAHLTCVLTLEVGGAEAAFPPQEELERKDLVFWVETESVAAAAVGFGGGAQVAESSRWLAGVHKTSLFWSWTLREGEKKAGAKAWTMRLVEELFVSYTFKNQKDSARVHICTVTFFLSYHWVPRTPSMAPGAHGSLVRNLLPLFPCLLPPLHGANAELQ